MDERRDRSKYSRVKENEVHIAPDVTDIDPGRAEQVAAKLRELLYGKHIAHSRRAPGRSRFRMIVIDGELEPVPIRELFRGSVEPL